MSDSDPLGGSPFGEGFSFEDLTKMLSSLGGLGGPAGDPWAQARQIAQTVATEGQSEPNLDPKVRMAVEDLARVADLHVRQLPTLDLHPEARVRAVTRSTWVSESFSAYRPFMERFGEAMGEANSAMVAEAGGADPMAAMFGQMFTSMGPMMVAASAGSMIGHLAQHTLGQYDLPVPREGHEILVVPTAIDDAAAEWAVSVDELRLWVLVHELVSHAVLSTPHVRRQMDALMMDFAAAFRPDPARIADELGDITDFSQIAHLSQQLGDPDTVLSMMRSPAHDLLLPRLDALVAVILGAVDHAVCTICEPLVSDHAAIREHLQSRQVDVAPADKFMERLLGIDITDATLRRGRAFIDGVIERADEGVLTRLWADELDLPTAAEVDAPGLWLARIGLDPEMPGGTTFEIPDDLSGLDDA